MNKDCWNCFQILPYDANFCVSCGAPQGEVVSTRHIDAGFEAVIQWGGERMIACFFGRSLIHFQLEDLKGEKQRMGMKKQAKCPGYGPYE